MSAFNLYYKQLLLEFQENFIQQVIKKFPDVEENIVRFYLTEFERYKQEIPPNKRDPLQYKTFEELEQTVDAIKGNKPRDTKKVQIDVDKNDIVAEDDNVVIYRGDSQDKCIMYGQGYTFCISRRFGGNMYSHYRLGKESTFYFIYFKKKSKDENDHIMVLDHTNKGYEWTFKNNRTQEVKGGWKTIVKNYPELKPYESLLVNKKLEEVERAEVEAIRSFINYPTLKKFLKFDYRMRSTVLKSSVNLRDDIFDVLNNDLINEFLSIGPNLTPHQVESLKENQIKWYLKNREIQYKEYVEQHFYKYNTLDLNIESIKIKTEEAYRLAYSRAQLGFLDLSYSTFLLKLPNNIPNVIKGSFSCDNCNLLSLENAPKEVSGSFYCQNNNITSLKGAPTRVGSNFVCSNNKITSLEGAPTRVGSNFVCSNNKITSLEGAPTRVGSDFVCSNNELTTLEGAPTRVGSDFVCSNNELTTLEGAPEKIRFSFDCSYNQLTDLKDAPTEVGGSFNCQVNNLSSLEGAPTTVGGDFNCQFNNLRSLEGSPKKVGRDFICRSNYLTSLEGISVVKSIANVSAYHQKNGVNFTVEEIEAAIQDSSDRLKRKKLPESTKLSQADILKSFGKIIKNK